MLTIALLVTGYTSSVSGAQTAVRWLLHLIFRMQGNKGRGTVIDLSCILSPAFRCIGIIDRVLLYTCLQIVLLSQSSPVIGIPQMKSMPNPGFSGRYILPFRI